MNAAILSAGPRSFLLLVLGVCLMTGCDLSGGKASQEGGEAPRDNGTPQGRRDDGGQDLASGELKSAANFKKQVEGLSEDGVRRLWTKLQGDGLKADEKRFRECQIIEELTRMGSFDAALELVSTYGPGDHRDAMVFSLFSKNPDKLSVLLARMNAEGFSERDKNGAMRGIARNIAGPDGYKKVSDLLQSGHKLSRDEACMISSAVGAGIDLGQMGMQYYYDPDIPSDQLSDSELASRYLKAESLLLSLTSAAPELKKDILTSFFDRVGELAPFQCWGTFGELYGTMGESERSKLATSLTRSMFAESPAQAIEAIGSMRSKIDVSGIMGAGVEEWLRVDSSAARDWASENKGKLPAKESSQVASSVAKYMANQGDVADAWKWVAEISDPDVKKKAEGVVWGKEKSQLVSEAKKAPQALVESIVSGNSKYGDYWLEEAMNNWVRSDFDKANSWYQQNWNSIPTGKSQYLAAAFASRAIEQGDKELASQWAGYINDPKTKARIEAAITKVTGK